MAKRKIIREQENETPAPIALQPITETIEKNYMPYVMSVIISRAIPEIDGFKPAHRKLLYTMYKMGLLGGSRTKSTNVVGATMKLNPHGDAAIYETMVRLTRGNEALAHPFVDSKGNFGKQYSSDMAYAASRYTEVRLDPFCAEIFRGIDKNAVDFTDNYDATMKEPVLLPVSFPNVLVSPNMGIAVGMASKICPFNLGEICDGTAAMLKNGDITTDELLEIVKAPDFPGGASIIYNREALRKIYETGEGSFTLRSRYRYDKSENRIEVLEIPYTTTIEEILRKVTDMIKTGALKDVSDARNEIDIHGFKLTFDLKRGVDGDKLMAKLYKKTTLQDNFSCNFNILVNGSPKLMGLKGIMSEWITFRIACVKRELNFELARKLDKMHLLKGLGEILLDIDKAIKIIRETAKESEVVPNLMEGFSLDRIQAEYIAEIKLRNLNREYILNRIKEISDLRDEIADLRDTVDSETKIKKLIIGQLADIKKKYGIARKTLLIYDDDTPEVTKEDFIENYNVKLVLTRESYFKKLSPLSYKASEEQALKSGDEVIQVEDAENITDVLFIGGGKKLYKLRASDFETKKSAMLGDYLPVVFKKLGMEPDESIYAIMPVDESKTERKLIYIFENGKAVRIPLSCYETKSSRKKISGAYSGTSPLVAAFYEDECFDIVVTSDSGRAMLVNSSLICEKLTRTAAGTTLFSLKDGQKLTGAFKYNPERDVKYKSCRKIKLPSTGSILK